MENLSYQAEVFTIDKQYSLQGVLFLFLSIQSVTAGYSRISHVEVSQIWNIRTWLKRDNPLPGFDVFWHIIYSNTRPLSHQRVHCAPTLPLPLAPLSRLFLWEAADNFRLLLVLTVLVPFYLWEHAVYSISLYLHLLVLLCNLHLIPALESCPFAHSYVFCPVYITSLFSISVVFFFVHLRPKWFGSGWIW